MKRSVALLLWIFLTSCAVTKELPSVSVSIEDMEGVGNPNIQECQLPLSGSPSMYPCVISINFDWQVYTDLL